MSDNDPAKRCVVALLYRPNCTNVFAAAIDPTVAVREFTAIPDTYWVRVHEVPEKTYVHAV
jgi:hypothetical protein